MNPFYCKYGLKITKILKRANGDIEPNVKIKLISQKRVTQRLKSKLA